MKIPILNNKKASLLVCCLISLLSFSSIHAQDYVMANGFPVPQRGLVSTNRGHHWIIEDNTLLWANGVSLDVGKEDWEAIDPRIFQE